MVAPNSNTPPNTPHTPPPQLVSRGFNITDMFDEKTQQSDGNWKTTCPACGLQGNRTEGFIIFPDSDRGLGHAFCQSSGKNFDLLSAYALKHKFIQCMDGKETGEKKQIIPNDMLGQVIEHFKNSYGEPIWDEVAEVMGFKKEIEIPGNDRLVSTFSREVATVIGPKNVLFYRPETKKIVEVNKIEHVNKDKTTFDGFVDMTNGRFVTIIERYFKPYTTVITKNGKMTFGKSLPQSGSGPVMESDDFRARIPIINRQFLVPIPILHEGELTWPKPGYDFRFGSSLPHNAPKIDPDMPLDDALKLIHHIYEEFCFEDKEKDEAKAIAALLTPFTKGLLPKFCTRTPLFIYEANRERSGKDYCAGVTGIVFEGQALEEPPICNDEPRQSDQNAELRKKLLASLMAGRKRLHFSNNRGKMKNAVFEGFITAEYFNDRQLSKNINISFPNETDLSISANAGLELTADLNNRSIFITLFLDLEDANAREFDTPDLHGFVLENREKILSALYALVKNWHDKGMPEGSIPFASFPAWAKTVGGIMECAGLQNPCIRDEIREGIVDIETQDIKRLFELCYESHPNIWIERSKVMDVLTSSQNLGEELYGYIDFTDHAGKIKFWKNFNKFVGRIFSDIKLTHDGNSRVPRRKFKFEKKTSNIDPNLKRTKTKSGSVGSIGSHVSPQDLLYRDIEEGNPSTNSTNSTNLHGDSEKNENVGTENPYKSTEFRTNSGPKTEEFVQIEENEKQIDKNEKFGQNRTDKQSNHLSTPVVNTDKKDTTKSTETQYVKPKVGSDRETQFYDEECWDTRNIKTETTKDDVLKFIESNPGVDVKKLLDLGVGSFKFLGELKTEGLVREEEHKLWPSA